MITVDVLCARIQTLRLSDVERWIEADWLRPEGTAGHYLFREIDEARVRLIIELRDEMGIDEDALPVVLSLLDQLYNTRRQMMYVREALDAPDLQTLRSRVQEVLNQRLS